MVYIVPIRYQFIRCQDRLGNKKTCKYEAMNRKVLAHNISDTDTDISGGEKLK